MTSPAKSSSGVISTEYVAPVPAKFPGEPFVTSMSSSVKPLTLSENLMVTSNAPCAGKSSQLSIVTVGDAVVFTREALASPNIAPGRVIPRPPLRPRER